MASFSGTTPSQNETLNFKLESVSYEWTVEDYGFRSEHLFGCIRSPTFISGVCKWYVCFYAEGVTVPEFSSIYLRLESSPDEGVFATAKIVARSSGGHVLGDWSGGRSLHHRDDYFFGTPTFFRKCQLAACQGSSLVFAVDVSVSREELGTFAGGCYGVDLQTPKMKILEDITDVFSTERFSDVVLHVQGTEIPAHQVLLAARSPIFASLFAQDVTQKKKRVDLSEFDAETIRHLLRFIYTGKLSKLDVPSTIKLIKAARKYSVSDLVDLCSNFLLSRVDANNVMDILALADYLDNAALRQQALQFICNNGRSFLNTHRNNPIFHQYPGLLTQILTKALVRLDTK